MRAILLALALASCGDFGTPLAAGAATVQVHDVPSLEACVRKPGSYCQIVDNRVLNIVGVTLHMAAGTTLDCNRRGLIAPTAVGVQITNALKVTVEQCHFATGSRDPKCLSPSSDADLLGCPVGIDARGRSSLHALRNTFAGNGWDKDITCWAYPGDDTEPDCEVDHNRFRDAFYSVLMGADEHSPRPLHTGHASYHNNYSLRVHKRTFKCNAGYVCTASSNLVQWWGGDQCDASQIPPHGYGYAYSALGGATMTVHGDYFIPRPSPGCQDPIDDVPTSLPKAPVSWGTGRMILSGNAAPFALPAEVDTTGGLSVTHMGLGLPPTSLPAVVTDVHLNAGVP